MSASGMVRNLLSYAGLLTLAACGGGGGSSTPPPTPVTIGGAVSGLAGAGLVLKNNGGNDLSVTANGAFTFSSTVNSGAAYAVTVGTQPTAPAQNCVVASGSGTAPASNVTNVQVTCTTTETHTVSINVTGLSGTLVLQNNGGNDLTVTADGTASFATAVTYGNPYAVSILTQPTGQTCVLGSPASGTIALADVSVPVNCGLNPHTVGGSISNLLGSGLVLNNGAGATLTPAANATSYSFPMTYGDTYTISPTTQPTSPSQTCAVANASGTVTGDVANATVTCTTNTYTVGGTVSGLATGGTVVLQNNGGNNLTVSANGSFTFATAINSSAAYSVTRLTNPTVPAGTPAGQTCTVSNGSGTVTNANITSVTVTCVNNDTTAPTVANSAVYPLDTTVGADVHGTIRATFSEALNPSTVTGSTFTVTGPGNVPVTGGTVSLTNGNTTAVFTPAAGYGLGLQFNTDYTVKLTTAIKDVAGNPLAADKVWTFNTGKKIATGGYHTCVRYDEGDIKCWGSNNYGQLGLGDTNPRGVNPGEIGPAPTLPFVNLGGQKVLALTAGEEFTCARLENESVKCWGRNVEGELGQDNFTTIGDANANQIANLTAVSNLGVSHVVEIEAGAQHVCARFADGAIKCWGSNIGGQLGLGDTANRGGNPGDMASLTPISLGTNLKANRLVAYGGYTTCAILQNTLSSVKSLKCWGSNEFGQLGLGDGLALLDHGDRGNEANEMGDNLPAINLGGEPLQVVSASGHTCAVLVGGSLKCWGNNGWGQVMVAGGNGSPTNPAVCEPGNSCIGDEPGEATLNLVDVGAGHTVKQLSAGDRQTCVLLDNDAVKCWGDNTYGQLGQENTATVPKYGDDAGETVALLSAIDLGTTDVRSGLAVGTAVELTAGGFFQCVHFSSDLVKCWGHNGSRNGITGQGGQLGQGVTFNIGDDVNEMGDFTDSINLNR
ncbi:MAG: Ig-like domain-containing protein [Steroidobacteraceae bacterium]